MNNTCVSHIPDGFVPARVGVKDMRYPIKVRTRSGSLLDTIASVDVQAELPGNCGFDDLYKIGAAFMGCCEGIDIRIIKPMLDRMRRETGADSVSVKIKFPYFVRKSAPVSGVQSSMDYDCSLSGSVDSGDRWNLRMALTVPVSTVCPCSKEISDFGAHNQRGMVKLKVAPLRFLWFEDLIALVEESASCSLFSIVEDEDEKFCTEQGYDHPRFVEDLVREIALRLNKRPDIGWYSIEAENTESIHNHSAYALIEKNVV